MIPAQELEQLDNKVKAFGSFDTDIYGFQKEVRIIADKYDVAPENVIMQYFDWKSKRLKKT